MVDLETLDIKSTAAIVSIAAVDFDPMGYIGEKFHRNVTFESAVYYGTVSGQTLEWWFHQSEEVRNSLFEPEPVGLERALHDLVCFMLRCQIDGVWADSPAFDISILKNAFERCDMRWLVPYYDERDVRTLKKILPKEEWPEFEGTLHHPVDDAIFQARLVQKFFRWMNANRL